jgi:hypothetical protein
MEEAWLFHEVLFVSLTNKGVAGLSPSEGANQPVFDGSRRMGAKSTINAQIYSTHAANVLNFVEKSTSMLCNSGCW